MGKWDGNGISKIDTLHSAADNILCMNASSYSKKYLATRQVYIYIYIIYVVFEEI